MTIDRRRVRHTILSVFLAGLAMAMIAVSGSEVSAQAMPFGAMNGDELQPTLQLEHFGPSLWTERSQEPVHHDASAHSKFDGSVPFAQSEWDAYAIQIKGQRLRFERDLVSNGGNAVPQDLGSFALGPFYRHKIESGDLFAADVLVGRSGVRLGDGQTATTVNASVFWSRPKNEDGGRWVYLLSYSNSRSTLNNVPLPGFAYVKSFRTETGGGFWAAGAPFFFAFYRGQPYSGTVLLTPFTSFVEGGYSLLGPYSVFARFGWSPQSYKIQNGPADRLIYEEFRTQLGLRGPIARWAMAAFGVAYSDGRRVVWGDSILKNVADEVRLDDELSLFFNLSCRW